jgi:hypothetical protein
MSFLEFRIDSFLSSYIWTFWFHFLGIFSVFCFPILFVKVLSFCPGTMAHNSTWVEEARRSKDRGQPGLHSETLSQKQGLGCSSVVECLPSKGLGSILTTKTNRKNPTFSFYDSIFSILFLFLFFR